MPRDNKHYIRVTILQRNSTPATMYGCLTRCSLDDRRKSIVVQVPNDFVFKLPFRYFAGYPYNDNNNSKNVDDYNNYSHFINSYT